MSGFDDREKAYEKKFAQEQQLDFTVEARTAKIFGLWAAEQLGLGASDANTYANDVIAANLEEAGFDDILRKVKKDFEAKGITLSDGAIKAQLDKSLGEAKKQIKGL